MSVESPKEQDITEIDYFKPTTDDIAFRRNRCWNATVDKHMSADDQFSLGTKLGLLQYNEKVANGDTPENAFLVIRNPQQAACNIIRHAFGEMIDKNFIPELYNMLKEKAYDKKNISDKAILEFVINNIPDKVFQYLKEYYIQHMQNQIKKIKPNLGESEEKRLARAEKIAGKEFFNLIMFQCVSYHLTEHTKKINHIDDKPTKEELSFYSNIPKVLKAACTANSSIEYDQQGNFVKVNTPGTGAEIPLLHLMAGKFDNAIPIENEGQDVDKINTIIEAANEQYKILDVTDAYGDALAHDSEFLAAIQSKDPIALNEEFKKAMVYYRLDKLGATKKENDNVFINIINKFAELGCPSALYYKGQALMGNHAKINAMMSMNMPMLFSRDIKTGLQFLAKLKEGDPLIHYAFSSKDKWSKEDVMAIQNQQAAIKIFVENLPNLYDEYKGSSKYEKSENKKVSTFLGQLAHQHFTDPKRENQIKLLQSIINNKKLTQEEKAATLLGAMDAIKSQIGVPRFDSRLITVMKKIEEGLKNSSKLSSSHDVISSVKPEERKKALSTYLDGMEHPLDKKFVDSIKKELEPKPDKTIVKKPSNS